MSIYYHTVSGLAFYLLLFKCSKITANRGILLLHYIDTHFSFFFHSHKIKNTKFQKPSITVSVQSIILPISFILTSCKEINAQMFITMVFFNCASLYIFSSPHTYPHSFIVLSPPPSIYLLKSK